MKYKPTQVPSSVPRPLQSWLARELQRIAQSLDSTAQESRKESSSMAYFMGSD